MWQLFRGPAHTMNSMKAGSSNGVNCMGSDHMSLPCHTPERGEKNCCADLSKMSP